MGSPIIIHEINPCSFYWYFKILLSLGQPVSLSCEVIGWTENTPHCLCPLENSYSTWHITASCSCNRTGLRPCLRNIRKRYRHQSPHKTTLLLTSCLFSFPITWQMRLIWSVNVIQCVCLSNKLFWVHDVSYKHLWVTTFCYLCLTLDIIVSTGLLFYSLCWREYSISMESSRDNKK